ncbi:hypothetical protein [Kitasatospora sp. NPDC097643]|uniref:hypothetical protein n=1 Tax=Kitasatospora sp. NPDC097643 TaxID=3157230 RepID=UPI003323CD4A
MTAHPPPTWTATEQRLWHAYRRGERTDLQTGDPQTDNPAHAATWPAERTVRAEALTHLLLHGPAPEPGHVPRLDLVGARITGRLDLTGATIGVPVKLRSCGFAERVLLDYAEITWWNLDGSHLPGLDGEGLRVGLWLGIRDATLTDDLWLHDARISGGLDLSRTTLLGGADDFALMGKQMTIDGGLRAHGLQAHGELLLSRSRIGGALDLTDARLGQTHGGAADFEDVHTRRVALRLDPASTGAINLASAEIGTLVADPARWPEQCTLNLTAATFTTLEPTADHPAADRLAWLAAHVVNPSPALYAQVAAAYTRSGQEQAAREVVIHKERLRYQSLGPAGRIWGRLLGITVGYGYRPSRALYWLLLLLAAGTAYFQVTGAPRAVNPGSGPSWDPLLYVIDLVVPFLSLGQRTAWDPAHTAKAIALLLTIAGWILTTAIAGGAARLLNRDK